jgi:hypothetical protein
MRTFGGEGELELDMTSVLALLFIVWIDLLSNDLFVPRWVVGRSYKGRKTGGMGL